MRQMSKKNRIEAIGFRLEEKGMDPGKGRVGVDSGENRDFLGQIRD
jgi:hypothetical protein